MALQRRHHPVVPAPGALGRSWILLRSAKQQRRAPQEATGHGNRYGGGSGRSGGARMNLRTCLGGRWDLWTKIHILRINKQSIDRLKYVRSRSLRLEMFHKHWAESNFFSSALDEEHSPNANVQEEIRKHLWLLSPLSSEFFNLLRAVHKQPKQTVSFRNQTFVWHK